MWQSISAMWGRSCKFHGEPSSAVTMVTMAGVSGQRLTRAGGSAWFYRHGEEGRSYWDAAAWGRPGQGTVWQWWRDGRRRRVELRSKQGAWRVAMVPGRSGSRVTRGTGLVLGGRAAKWPGQVAAPVYGAAVGTVQGSERLKKRSVAIS